MSSGVTLIITPPAGAATKERRTVSPGPPLGSERLNGGTRLDLRVGCLNRELAGDLGHLFRKLVGLRPLILGLNAFLGEGGRQPRLKFQPCALNVPKRVR
jgi:hypothetical protein